MMDTNKEKIKRVTSGKFSFNDYLSVSSYFQKDEFNDGLKKYMEEDWFETKNTYEKQERLTQLLDRLHHKINLKRPGKTNASHYFYRLFSKIAVVLLIPALITIGILSYFSITNANGSDSWAEIQSPIGSRTKFQLPDGTHGWLNSGSTIKYPINFKKRSVGVSGEVWFDVVHQKSSDFQVITPYFDVKVLGTQFNVIAYDNEETAEVILERGKVRVYGKDQKLMSELIPDQDLVFEKSTNKIIKKSIDSKSYTSWKDGLLVFKNVPMNEIAKRLSRRFNAEIVLHGDSLKSSIFRATFQDEDLDEICKMLSTVAPIEFKIHKRKKQSDDSFTKSKIEMWLKN